MKTLDLDRFKDIDITQRDNEFYSSVACFPSSAAIAINYLKPDIKTGDTIQTADYIVKKCMDLSSTEKQEIISINKSSWMFNGDSKPFQYIPIEQYVIKKYLYDKVWAAWRNQFSDIIDSIDRGIPVVALGNFSSISYVGGHYVAIVGYNKEKETVIVVDPFGNAHTNYKDKNSFAIEYDWSIFIREQGKYSYGLWFK